MAAAALVAAADTDGARWWSCIEFLASDKLVASQFERDGLKRAGEQGTFSW